MISARRTQALTCLLILSFFAAKASAATSYLLIQGDFGGVSTTYKWEFIYNPGQISNGQDMLNLVFGTPSVNVAQPIYTETGLFGGPVEYDTAQKGTQAAGYLNYGFALLVESFTVNSQKLAQDTDSDPGWLYYNASGTDGGTTTYDNGVWSFANSGAAGRPLSDGSYDGWVFGTNDFSGSTASIVGSSNLPVASNFTSSSGNFTVIDLTSTVPEPGRAMLLGCGTVLAFMRRRRKGA